MCIIRSYIDTYPWKIQLSISKVHLDCQLYIMLSAIGDDGMLILWHTFLKPLGLWMRRPGDDH